MYKRYVKVLCRRYISIVHALNDALTQCISVHRTFAVRAAFFPPSGTTGAVNSRFLGVVPLGASGVLVVGGACCGNTYVCRGHVNTRAVAT